MPSTVRTARTPTDLNPNLIRVQKRDDERADRRESGQRVKEFQHMVTSDQIVGRPRTECVVLSILAEAVTVELNRQIATVSKRMPLGTRKSNPRCHECRVPKPSAKTSPLIPMGKSNYEAGG